MIDWLKDLSTGKVVLDSGTTHAGSGVGLPKLGNFKTNATSQDKRVRLFSEEGMRGI